METRLIIIMVYAEKYFVVHILNRYYDFHFPVKSFTLLPRLFSNHDFLFQGLFVLYSFDFSSGYLYIEIFGRNIT